MGIPTYFRKIIELYPNTHFWNSFLSVDNFFIDFNAMIYQVIRRIDSNLNVFEFERQLIRDTVKHLKHVINDVVKPKKCVMIAMDGPPPRAKMVQQRARRYKTILETSFKKELEHRHKTTIPTNTWSSASISPGTVFMNLLAKAIKKAVDNKEFNVPSVIFSDSSISGEGEHKLMPSIRASVGSSVIYSPDADMIVLAIMTNKDDMYILREPGDTEIEKELYSKHEFIYLSITEARVGFFHELTKEYDIPSESNHKEVVNSFLDDYTFLTFLCGNDFVRHAPFMRVKDGGLTLLINIYRKHYKRNHLIINGKINKGFFVKIIEALADGEQKRGQHWQKRRDRYRKGLKVPKDDPDKQMWEREYDRFQHEEYYSVYHPQHEIFNRVFNAIDYYGDNWKHSYNNFYFKGVSLETVCSEYYKSLIFCWKYYHKEVPSWTWFYPCRASPTMTDFKDYILSKYEAPTFELGEPYKPLEQLLMILPKTAFHLIPKSLHSVDERYFPYDVKLDVYTGEKFIYSEPMLPEIPDEYIKNFVRGASLSDSEKTRNKVN